MLSSHEQMSVGNMSRYTCTFYNRLQTINEGDPEISLPFPSLAVHSPA